MGFIRRSLEFLTEASNRGAKKPEDFLALAIMDAGAKALGKEKMGKLPEGGRLSKVGKEMAKTGKGMAKRALKASERAEVKRKKRAKKHVKRR